MQTKADAMLVGSFVADALALGAHWIYDSDHIERKFGRVNRFVAPLEDSFHPTKGPGDFTHYGDQTLVLIESISVCCGFDLNLFAQSWIAFFDGYDGYFDHATLETLDHFSAGRGPAEAGSASTDLGGAARIAPLVYCYRDNMKDCIAAVRAQTAMTHNQPEVIAAAEFFARAAFQILQGACPTTALDQAARTNASDPAIAQWVASGMASRESDTRTAIAQFGQDCRAAAAFPAVVHLLSRYEQDFEAALVENVMAGGDSAARGMLVGMLLGAHLGPEAVPAAWLAGLGRYGDICDLMQRMA